MEITSRRVDRSLRVKLFADFAGQRVVVKRISGNEVRVIKAEASPMRYSLKEMLKHVTPETLHSEVDTGPGVGAEQW